MKIEFTDTEFERLAFDASYRGKAKWSVDIIKTYRKKLTFIKAAQNRIELGSMRSLNLEKLKGKRKGDWSIRLDKQWRMTFNFRKATNGEIVVVIRIEDYH